MRVKTNDAILRIRENPRELKEERKSKGGGRLTGGGDPEDRSVWLRGSVSGSLWTGRGGGQGEGVKG